MPIAHDAYAEPLRLQVGRSRIITLYPVPADYAGYMARKLVRYERRLAQKAGR